MFSPTNELQATSVTSAATCNLIEPHKVAPTVDGSASVIAFGFKHGLIAIVRFQVCHSKNGDINPVKIQKLVNGYVKKYSHLRKKTQRTFWASFCCCEKKFCCLDLLSIFEGINECFSFVFFIHRGPVVEVSWKMQLFRRVKWTIKTLNRFSVASISCILILKVLLQIVINAEQAFSG